MSCCYEGETTETRRVKIFVNTFRRCLIYWYPEYFCWKYADMEATLTGWIILVAAWLVSRFVASRLVDRNSKIFQVFVASGVSTYWRRCCKIASKVCPCTTFCQQKPFCQRHGVGPLLAAPNKDQTSWRTVAPKWQTFCMLCILGLQEYATMNCKYWSVSGVQNVLHAIVCSVGSPVTSAFGFGKVAGKSKRN